MSPIASTSKATTSNSAAPAQEKKKISRASKWKQKLAEKRGLDVDDEEDEDFESDTDYIPNISKLNISTELSMDGYSNVKLGNVFGSMKKLEDAADSEISKKE